MEIETRKLKISALQNLLFACCCIPCTTSAQSFALGAHTLLWQEEGNGISPAQSAAIDTATQGSELIVFNAGYASNNAIPTDNKNNTWSILGSPVVYRGYGGAFDVKAYRVTNALGGTNHQVSIIKSGYTAGEITVPFIEVQNATLSSVVVTYPEAASVVGSASVHTNGPALLLAFWWGDASGLFHSAIPDNGFSMVESLLLLPPNSAVQAAVAQRVVSGAGDYAVNWTQSPSQGAVLWLMAFEPSVAEPLFVNGFE